MLKGLVWRCFMVDRLSRRSFFNFNACAALATTLPAAKSTTALAQQITQEPDAKLVPVTALITSYYPVSHADVIVSKILEGYQRNGGPPKSGLKLVSMYVEQQHRDDISQALAVRYGVRLCKTIDEAITLGSDQVQVDGVLSIAEHGEYPFTRDTQQKMYPRRRFF